ncbi:hypothetical protein [Halomonas sp. H5]|uniref:hypothetical protein n=1 Tax=Halomonas sp. H5 TaxID=3423910 RepID=UPI003D36CBC0
MMLLKRLWKILAAFFLCGLVVASELGPSFRNVSWYQTLGQVMELELAEFVEYRTEELNMAVDPPRPWSVEHLYFKDVLLERPVLILYRFDLDCQQLYQAEYVFEEVLDDRDIGHLASVIEEKYGVSLDMIYLGGMLFASGVLNGSTRVQINQYGHLHFHRNKTVVYYYTRNFHQLGGWREGTEPECQKALIRDRVLRERL